MSKFLIEQDAENLKRSVENNDDNSWSFSNYSLIKANGDILDIEGIPSPTLFDGKASFQLSFLDISDKKKMEAAVEKVAATEKFNKVLQKELAEKEVLLKEVHHRVKNNMQVISSILSLQKSHHDDEKIKEILSESQSRIRSMALIHEKLYANKDFANIPFDSYLRDLVNNIVQTYELKKGPVEINFDLQELFLNLDAAIPCGLIVNELVVNALKYAFNSSKGGILSVQLKEHNTQVEISVKDNGPGMDENKWTDSPETLGLQLVQTLCEQLEGEISMKNDNGASFSFKFYRFETQ